MVSERGPCYFTGIIVHINWAHGRLLERRRPGVPRRPRLPDRSPRRLRRRPRRLPLAAPRPLQLGARLLRRPGPRQPPHRPLDRRRRRRRDPPQLRGHGRALEPGRQFPARPRRRPRRPRAGDAPQRRASLGDHAGGDQAGRRDQPGHHIAVQRRPSGPHRARRDAPRDRRRALGRQARGGPRRLHPHRRRWRGRRLAFLRRSRGGAGGVRARRPHPCGRPLPPLFHLRHHGQAQDGPAHPAELSRGAPLDALLDRPARGGRAPQHQLARLGQARLELLFRPLERRRDHLHPSAAALRRRRRRWPPWRATASPPSARPPPSGGC